MKLRFDIVYWTELLHEFTDMDYMQIFNNYMTADKTSWDYGKLLDLTKEEDKRKYYNQLSLLFSYVNWHLNVAREKRRILADKLYGNVLDYGCGIATHSLWANYQRGVKIDLYDLDTVTKGFLKFVIEKHNLSNIRFIDEYELHEKNYDCIVCTDVIEHIENYKEILSYFKVALTDNGKLFIRAPFNNDFDPSHIPNKKTIEELLKEAGIEPKNYEVVEI